MSDQVNLPQITMANTKKEMVEAYQLVKRQVKEKEKQVLDAEKARKQAEMQVAETTAEAEASQDPLQRLHTLKSAISRELTDLAGKFEEELDTFRKIQAAVKNKQEEIKTIYEVETAASDLAALIQAQHVKRDEFNKKMDEERGALDEEMRNAREEWEKEGDAYDRETKETADQLKKQRQREKEEYEYAFNREKEQKTNQLKDELQLLERELEQKRTEFENEFSQRRQDLESREEIVSKSEEEMNRLGAEVDTYPGRLEDSINKAVKETTERLVSDFKKSEALLKATFDGEKNVLLSKIESLEKAVASQETQIAELSKRNDQAYEKVQDIANRAVAASKKEYVAVPPVFQEKTMQNDK